ncbi:MAG TPA: hypothetical protein VK527_07435 [Candidatus Limnocylindrales bacterium]|nr:hypothetical protein [Candidatus Limnocylindrales bacterium]
MDPYRTPYRVVCCAFALLIWAPVARAATATPPQTPGAVPAQGTVLEPPATPQASPFAASGSVTFASRYLFQGIDYSNANPVLNPQADLTAGPLKAKLWINHDLDQGVSDEFDLSVFHEWTASKFSFATGYTYLWYPHRDGWDPSQELYVEGSREGALNPTLSVHYDFDAGMGSYSAFGLSRSIGRSAWGASLGANIFYQDHYYGLSGFPASEWNVHVEKSVKKTTITPSVSRFVTWSNGDFRDENAVKSAWLFTLQIARDF